MKEKIAIVLMVIGIAAFSGLSVFFYMTADHEAPVLTIPNEDVTYVEADGTEVLLSAVTAMDNRDGDLTDSIRIDGVIPSDNGKTAVVTYAVYDKSNNVAKKKRTVYYVAADAK